MKKFIKWFAIVFAAFILLGAIFGSGEGTKNTTTENNNTATSGQEASAEAPQPADQPAAEQAIKISANEVLKAYKENEVGANMKYKGKKLDIAATVSSIEAGFGDKPYLVLKAGGEMDMFNQPQAHLAKSEFEKAADLKKGQKIELVCTGNSEVAGTPMLDDCIIQ